MRPLSNANSIENDGQCHLNVYYDQSIFNLKKVGKKTFLFWLIEGFRDV